MSRTAESTLITKEKIADALLDLMTERPFSSIKIEDITEKAGVGRVTYFRNFSSKEEIITYKFIRMWERYCAEHDLKERRHFNIDNAQDFFAYAGVYQGKRHAAAGERFLQKKDGGV